MEYADVDIQKVIRLMFVINHRMYNHFKKGNISEKVWTRMDKSVTEIKDLLKNIDAVLVHPKLETQ